MTTTTPPISPAQAAALADRFFLTALWTAVAIFAATFLGLFVQFVQGSRQSIGAFGLNFLVSSSWNPVTGRHGGIFPRRKAATIKD